MFAVVLHGSGEGAARLDELSRTAHMAIGRAYAPVYVPHISLGIYSADGHEARNVADRFADSARSFDLSIGGIGVFPAPLGVVYAAPIATGSLIALHAQFVEAFHTFAAEMVDYYRAGKWIPHATLLMPATAREQGAALTALADGWQPFAFRLSRLSVVRVPDGQMIAEFALSG